MYDNEYIKRLRGMNGNEFEKRVRRLGKKTGQAVRLDQHGKGSHCRLYYGGRFTTLKDRKKEIGDGLLSAMCSQLGIDAADL
jgi:mRNA interferase HicA